MKQSANLSRNPTDFELRVYAVVAKIPEGRVATYGQIARILGCRGYRAVGMALNRNPYAPEIPCHRVVASDGGIGGFAQGTAAKKAILSREGVIVSNDYVVDFDRVMMDWETILQKFI